MKNLLKDSKAYYENNDYYEIFSIAEDSENKVSSYLETISKDKIILDAGCGTGKFLNILEKNATKYIGIDLSNEQLKKAKSKSLKDSSVFMCSNLTNLQIPHNSIDLIVSSWVLGTITDVDERNKAISELKRVLKQNGIIVLVENAQGSEFESLRDRDKDNRTKLYNDWILDNGFILDKSIDTCFNFKDLDETKKCFDVIYGKKVSDKITNNIIEHKINIYKYNN